MTSQSLSEILYVNAIRILAKERRLAGRVNEAYGLLTGHGIRASVHAGIEDWLSNAFVMSAMTILEKFSGNYRVREALALLKEAGAEARKGIKAPRTRPRGK